MRDNNSKYHILSEDKAKNTINTLTRVTITTMLSRIGMWGEGEFGKTLILGAGSQITSVVGEGLDILSDDLAKNTERRSVNIYIVTMSERMLVWGAAQFGTNDILGAGSLVTGEG